MNYKKIEDLYSLDVYPKRDIVLVSGDGAILVDNNGKEYIDCTAGVGVANVGHANPFVAQAIAEQSKKLITCYSIFYNDKRAELLERLVKVAPKGLTKVFLCNSGTEAVEAALKLSRTTTKKQEIIALMRGFHGKTIGALSMTWAKEYQDPFQPLMPGVRHIPANNIEALSKQITENTAAVIMELIQGEGGVMPLEKKYVQEVRRLTKEKGILLIIDEVQTGFGRTGTMFATEQYEIQPDILCCAKGIAGGIPMGATLCSSAITAPKKSHTTTFGGNPLACAAALATISYIEKENLIKESARKGKYLIEQLQKISSSKIREVRGAGLMIGIELKERAGMYVQALTEQGILVLLAGPTVIRLLPPLVITEKQIDVVVDAIRKVLS